jgi:hypothetical protein
VTEEQATPGAIFPAGPTSGPTFPPGRYGRRRQPRPPRRWLTALLAVVVALAFGGIAYVLFLRYGNPDYEATVLAETDRTDASVTVRFVVLSRPGTGPASCRLRARAADGAVVGTADVAVPAGRRVVHTYTLATTARSTATEVPTCRRATGG